ncbi:hypothetical protein [Clostridium ihumii]|uniref:hypothetical protein n=1 Tax=Clostridium ihumii TaxID=1470356 RepID=UPI003D350055
MKTTINEETLTYIKGITRGAKMELPKNTTNTEKKKMIGYISEKIDSLKDDANPKIEENLLHVLKMLQSDLANKKDEMIIESLSKGEIPDEFENLSENSKINRLNRLKMIVEYRLNEQDNNEEKNYEKALEVILNQFENIK